MNRLILAASLVVFYLVSSILTNAQTFKVTLPPGYNKIIQNESIAGVEGSQYLSEDWTQGTVTFNDGSEVGPLNLRLNAFRNEIHFQENNKEYSIGATDNIKEVLMGGRKFIYRSYTKDGVAAQSYFEVLVEGKTELLVLYYIERMPANYNQTMDTGEKNDRLKLGEKIYIKNGDNIIEHDKKGKKLLATLGVRGEQLKKQIEEEDLSFKKKEDMIKIVNFLNSVN